MATIGYIAGMHRSGTSALSRVMNLLGYDIPGDIDTNTHHNASGHWEPVAFVALNTQLISALGADWCALRLPETSDFTALDASHHAAIRAYADASFGAHPYTVVKDPRVCYTLPLWLAETTRRGHQPIVLLPYRHPVEVARSLAARDAMPLNAGLALWLCSMLCAEAYSRGVPRAAVGFDALIADWRSAYQPVAALTGAAIPSSDDALGQQIDSFINRSQRHHTVIEITPELREHSMLPLALEAYACFEQPLDTRAAAAAFDALRAAVRTSIERDGLVERCAQFGREYALARALDERDQVIATLRREMAENHRIAQHIADEREALKVYQTDLLYRHRIIQQHQAAHIETLGHIRLRHETRLAELTQEVAWRVEQLTAVTEERDWLRSVEQSWFRERDWLQTIINDQSLLLRPVLPLVRLWHRIRRRFHA